MPGLRCLLMGIGVIFDPTPIKKDQKEDDKDKEKQDYSD